MQEYVTIKLNNEFRLVGIERDCEINEFLRESK